MDNDPEYSLLCRRLAVVCPTLLHGLYDFIATMDSTEPALGFIAFIAVMFLAAYGMIRRLSHKDRYI